MLGFFIMMLTSVTASAQVFHDPVAFCRLRLYEGNVELGSTFDLTVHVTETGGTVFVMNDLVGECDGRLRSGSSIPGAKNTAVLGGPDCRSSKTRVSLEPHDDPKRFTLWAHTDEFAKDRYLCTWVN